MGVPALVFAAEPGDLLRVGRSLRALSAKDIAASYCSVAKPCDLPGPGPIWLLRAGAWPAARGQPVFPSASATGRPLIALGVVRTRHGEPSSEASRWSELLQRCGGDFNRLERCRLLPPPASVYLDGTAAATLARQCTEGATLTTALTSLLSEERWRIVHFAPLDVFDDRGLRALHVVTSLQRGGAERITLDLNEELPRRGVRCRIVTLGRPTRKAFAAPPGTIDLSHLRGDRSARAATIARAARDFAADLIHVHLLDRDDVVRLAACGLPVVLTIHNARPGWPDGTADLRAGDSALVVSCAKTVEAELRASCVPIPVRTVWNGIKENYYLPTRASRATGAALRRDLGFATDDFVLLGLANPRPQKRLHLLPAILAATQSALGSSRTVRLILAGEASCISPAAGTARDCVDALNAEVARRGLADKVVWRQGVEDVPALLAAADVLVSTSAYEGLSLAHLEGLAAGLPVVATDAGGTRELAPQHAALTVLELDAPPERFAEVLAEIARQPRAERRPALAASFTRSRMAERYASLYRSALHARAARGEGLWLVSNNFSTGGAQSSARRLLLGLAGQGMRVRAAVIEEQPDHPTPGRRALVEAGVPVHALPPPGTADPAAAVAELLDLLAFDRPQAVLLWNVIPEYKVLLADGLLDLPLFDVSPGEMYFTSLERYFNRPRPGLPYRSAREYGARLAGVIVKYGAEAGRAADVLGAPVHVIPNGVPLLKTQTPPPRDRLILGTLARLHPHKKLEDLLDALRLAQEHMPPHVLRIAGAVERGCEDWAAELRRRAEGMQVDWVGEVEAESFLPELDLFVLVAEPAGCPNASLEAMAAGLPVLATDVGGIREQIVDGVTGCMVPRGDVTALADGLVALAHDPATRRSYGTAGRQRIADCFSIERMIAAYRTVTIGVSDGATLAVHGARGC